MVLGRWDQFPAPEDFWFDLHLWKSRIEPLWEYGWLLCSLHHSLFLLSIFSTVHKGNTVYQPLVLTVLFPLDDLHMCSWKIILKTKGGGEGSGKKKKYPLSVWQNCLESPLTSHCVLSVLPLHKSARGYDIRHGVWALLQLGAEELWKPWGWRGGREGIPVCPGWEQAARWGAASSASSELTLGVMLFLSQFSANEPFSSQPN